MIIWPQVSIYDCKECFGCKECVLAFLNGRDADLFKHGFACERFDEKEYYRYKDEKRMKEIEEEERAMGHRGWIRWYPNVTTSTSGNTRYYWKDQWGTWYSSSTDGTQ